MPVLLSWGMGAHASLLAQVYCAVVLVLSQAEELGQLGKELAGRALLLACGRDIGRGH